MACVDKRTRDVAAQAFKLAFPCGKGECKCAKLCEECQTSFEDAGSWVCEYDAILPHLDKKMTGGRAKAATVLNRTFALMQVQKVYGLDKVKRPGTDDMVSGWYKPSGAARSVIKNPYGDAWLAAESGQAGERAATAAGADTSVHFELKKSMFAVLCQTFLPKFDFEGDPRVALARLSDQAGPRGFSVLHSMQDFILYTIAMELTTRLESKCARLCSAADLEAWLALPDCRPVLRNANFFSFTDDGGIRYELFNDKRTNKADPNCIALARESFDVKERAPVLFKILPTWRELCRAAQSHLGYRDDGPISCASTAPFLFFDAENVPKGEAHLPLAMPRQPCAQCVDDDGREEDAYCARCVRERHRAVSGLLSRRLSKLQMDHSTAEERIAATGCAKGRLGCNSFRHTRAENDVGLYAVNFREVLAEIKAFATERRTTAAMIANVYCDQPVSAFDARKRTGKQARAVASARRSKRQRAR